MSSLPIVTINKDFIINVITIISSSSPPQVRSWERRAAQVKPGSRLVILLNHPLSSLHSHTLNSAPACLFFSLSCTSLSESCCAICSSDFFTGTILPGFLSTPSHLQICRTLIQVFSPHPLFGPILRGKHLCPASDFSYFVFYDEDKTPILPLFHALTVSAWENWRIYTFLPYLLFSCLRHFSRSPYISTPGFRRHKNVGSNKKTLLRNSQMFLSEIFAARPSVQHLDPHIPWSQLLF